MEASAAAKSQLNQFYQRCKSPLPRYDVKKAEGGFKCTIVCPSVYTEEASVELQIFTGKGANKKASQAAAAAEAVKFLQHQPLFAVKKPFVESLWETVKGSLSDQSLFKDNELEAFVILAQLCNDGYFPMQQLLPARSVRAWLKEYEPEAAQHPGQALQIVTTKLNQQSSATDDVLALSEDGKYIKRKIKYQRLSAAEQGFCKATKAVEIGLQLASGSAHGGVLLPVDIRAPVTTLEIGGKTDPWHATAKALGVEAHDLLFWEKPGKVVHIPRLPGYKATDKPQPLLEAFREALGEPVNTSQHMSEEKPAEGPVTPQPGTETISDPAANTKSNTPVVPSEGTNPPADNKPNTPLLPFEAINPPAMYTSTTQSTDPTALNARASWLAGRPVFGNALLTYTKIRHCAWLVPAVVFSSDFTLELFWEWVHGLLPEVEHVNRGMNALVTRLPTVFRHPKAWYGHDPWRMLSDLCTPGLCKVNPPAPPPTSVLATQPANPPKAKASVGQHSLAAQLQMQQDSHEAGDETVHSCKLQVMLQGTGQTLTASAQHTGEANIAKQQAALDMVHQLQHAVLAILTVSQPEKANAAAMHTDIDSNSNQALIVHHQGDVENSMPEIGNVVKVEYQLVLKGDAEKILAPDGPEEATEEATEKDSESVNVEATENMEITNADLSPPKANADDETVEQCSMFRFEWGGAGVIPEISDAVYRLGTGGKAVMPVHLPVGGPQLLAGSCPRLHCELRLTYLGHRYPAPAAPAAALFDPPLALQRHALVAGVMEQSGAQRLVDLGCGEGKLLEHLIRSQSCPALKQLIGVDITAEAVTRAGRKLLGAYRQADDPLSDPLQQWGGLAEGPSKPSGGPASKQLPGSQLYHGDIATASAADSGYWGGLAGIEAAALVEVVEHLDPTPLQSLGPSLLGGLQPKLLVVTTPNKEYNAVLQQLGIALLPNKLRNTDHRFEWSRQEFQQWGQGLAEKHGYSVKFWGAGRAMQEGRAIATLGMQGQDLGFASQVAVFRRKAADVQGRSNIAAPLGTDPGAGFGRLVADINSSGEPQVMMGNKRPSPRHESPELLESSVADAAMKRTRVE